MLLNVSRTGVVYKAAFYLGVASCTVGVSSCTGSHAVGTDHDGSYQLDNGLTVVLRPLPRSDRAAVVVLFNLGNVHDPVGQSGRAHLLEHLYATSATATSAARDMNQLVQRYGGQFNMQTGYDYTVIAGVVGADTVEEELKDAAMRMSGLTISEGDLEREIPRILSELKNMYGGIPALAGINHVRNRLNAIPSGGRYGGADEHLEAMSVDELQDVWRVYYKPNNATLAVAGGFDVAEVWDAIDRHFGSIPAGKESPPKAPAGKAPTGTVSRVGVSPVVPDVSPVVAMGYAAPRPVSELYAPFLIVVSRLLAEVQGRFTPGKPPPVYFTPLDDGSVIVLQSELSDADRAESALNGLDERLETALTAELSRADKQRTLNTMGMLGTVEIPSAMWRQNVYGLAFSAGRRLQLGIDGEALRKAIRETTDADMARLATRVFAPARRIAVVVEVAK